MPFKHLYIVFPPPPATTPSPTPVPEKKAKKKYFFFILDSLSICKNFTITESSWQIIQIRKKLGGLWGECVGLGEWGVVVNEFFDKDPILFYFFFWEGGGLFL